MSPSSPNCAISIRHRKKNIRGIWSCGKINRSLNYTELLIFQAHKKDDNAANLMTLQNFNGHDTQDLSDESITEMLFAACSICIFDL